MKNLFLASIALLLSQLVFAADDDNAVHSLAGASCRPGTRRVIPDSQVGSFF